MSKRQPVRRVYSLEIRICNPSRACLHILFGKTYLHISSVVPTWTYYTLVIIIEGSTKITIYYVYIHGHKQTLCYV